MGKLYDRMAQDLKLKNLAATTQKKYLRCCCIFVRYHMKSPRELDEEEWSDVVPDVGRERRCGRPIAPCSKLAHDSFRRARD
ncbi:MAG: phage integrase N-terminal SAM-like domain-containing protein [Myxococcaceae bacterium]